MIGERGWDPPDKRNSCPKVLSQSCGAIDDCPPNSELQKSGDNLAGLCRCGHDNIHFIIVIQSNGRIRLMRVKPPRDSLQIFEMVSA